MKSDMEALIEDLRAYTSDDVANPWREQDETELDLPGAAALRRDYLRRYLAVRPAPRVLLLAEAAGYQGCRFSGIALTCERMLLGHHKRVGPQDIFLMPETVERTSRVTDGMPDSVITNRRIPWCGRRHWTRDCGRNRFYFGIFFRFIRIRRRIRSPIARRRKRNSPRD